MEELTADNITKSSVSDYSESKLPSVDSPENEENSRDVDYRIACSNSRSLDSITKIVSSHVAEFAKFRIRGEEQSQFTSRVMEIFKDTIQENVTVNGLPYVYDKKLLTPSNNKVTTNEAREALLSNISKKVQDVCEKRRRVPKEYSRIYKMRLHHEFQNMKKATVTHKVSLPTVSKELFHSDSLSSEKFQEASEQINYSQNILLDTVNELKEMQNNIEYGKRVADKQEYM